MNGNAGNGTGQIMAGLSANGWSDGEIAKAFKVTPATVARCLMPGTWGTCGVCEAPHMRCPQRDWIPVSRTALAVLALLLALAGCGNTGHPVPGPQTAVEAAGR